MLLSKLEYEGLSKEQAISLGVPENDIIIEDKSTNTKENVVFSRKVFEHEFGNGNFSRLLIVTTWGHMRRAILTLKTYMPKEVNYSMCSSYPEIKNVGTWSQDWDQVEEAKKRIKTEVKAIVKYINKGDLIDWDTDWDEGC
ncbi:MAG TPA: hypothetical protein DEG71_08960 [Clostridiales bacterium]|nr:hypothetical protein [Clostridiales bacterium]